MKLHPARVIACRALVVGGLVASSAWAEPPSPTSTSATLAGSEYATLISADPLPLRTYVSAGGVAIDAFELTPGPHRVTVEYEESRKRKVEGFESRDTRMPSLESSRLRSRCALEFDFQANQLYRVVRSSIAEDGKLKRFNTDNWGVWLVAEAWDRPMAQCL
ncbi:MAG: hypothetical protein ACRES3_10265 [Steroidobacteraceae bacterium]